MKLFNTLTRKLEPFMPLKGKEVRMYTCGPTVYDFAHIGNFRAYIFEDLLRRWLKYKGYKVKQVMNLTDVDDKTIKGANKAKISLRKYTDKYKKAFFEDLDELNIERAEVYPAATDHINEMVDLIKKLLKKGYAYKSEDGSIYYSVSKFKDYGKLAHIKFEDLKAGARVKQDEYQKGQAQDFALWKAWDKEDGDVFWETELGKGRPGWHIECSAMSIKHLGETFDIHTGGVDNMFPHHENEIAQSEGATGKKFVNLWMHNEHLLVDGKKMSKSLGNFYTLRDLLNKGYDPIAIRYLLLSTHYRQQLNFTFEGIEAAKKSIQKLQDFYDRLEESDGEDIAGALIDDYTKRFEDAMDDDLNISKALGSIFEFMNEINKLNLSKDEGAKVQEFMKKIDSVLGVLRLEKVDLDKEVGELIKKREKAREEKDYNTADRIRDILSERGIILEDTTKGVRWKKREEPNIYEHTEPGA